MLHGWEKGKGKELRERGKTNLLSAYGEKINTKSTVTGGR